MLGEGPPTLFPDKFLVPDPYALRLADAFDEFREEALEPVPKFI